MRNSSTRLLTESTGFLFAALIFGAGFCDSARARIIEFDPPGSTYTYPVGINASKWIAGQYFDGENNHSFVRSPDGTITTIDVQGATCGTYAHGINRSGVIVGGVGVENANTCFGPAFIRAADGTVTTFDMPNSIDTEAFGVNNPGLITGTYEDSGNDIHGFLRAIDGSLTSFDPLGSIYTAPRSINKSGAIAGSYEDSTKVWHGFLRATDGTITTFDPPGSSSTYASDINDSGEIAGYYNDSQNARYGFLRTGDGTITTIDPDSSSEATASAINGSGEVTGFYVTQNSGLYGFVRAADGTATSFTVKNSAGVWDTSGINNKGAITGSYLDIDQITVHGFLRTP